MIHDYEVNKLEAIRRLVGGRVSGNIDGSDTTYLDNQTPPSEKEITDKMSELEAEWTAQAYARQRQSAYDSVGNQLDMLMKDMRDGTTTHQESCEAVKTKFPKG
jgi:hypothetical protein